MDVSFFIYLYSHYYVVVIKNQLNSLLVLLFVSRIPLESRIWIYNDAINKLLNYTNVNAEKIFNIVAGFLYTLLNGVTSND